MEMKSLIEAMCAVHLSSRVEGPMHGRGGMMLIGPPEALKSTFLSVLDKKYPDIIILSDLNVKSMVRLTQTALATGSVRTLVFPELAKLYERQQVTSQNLEGVLRALVAEGFSGASFQEPGVNRFLATATVMGAMTPATIDSKVEGWNDSGFSRRFLWPLIRLENPDVLQNALNRWESLELGITSVIAPPPLGTIPNLTTEAERKALIGLVKYQPPHGGEHTLQRALLIRMLAVLKWWNREQGKKADEAMHTIEDFGSALGRVGTTVTLPGQTWAEQMRDFAVSAKVATNGNKKRKGLRGKDRKKRKVRRG
jgi:hypothetical protein